MDCICGKRLSPILKDVIPILETHKEIVIDSGTRDKICKISPATIDRLLSEEKKRYQLKGKSHTNPPWAVNFSLGVSSLYGNKVCATIHI